MRYFALSIAFTFIAGPAGAQTLSKIECPPGQELYSFGLGPSAPQTTASIGEPGGGLFGPKVEVADGNRNLRLEICMDSATEQIELKRVEYRGGDIVRRGMFHGGNPLVRVITIDGKVSSVVKDPALASLAREEIHAMLAPSKSVTIRGSLRDLLFGSASSFEMLIPLGDVGVPDFASGGMREVNTTQFLRLTQKTIAGETLLVARPEMKDAKLSRNSAILTGKIEIGNPFGFCEGTSQVIEQQVTLGTAVIRMKGCKDASFGGSGAAWSEDYKLVSIKDDNPALAQKIDITLDEAALKNSFQYRSDQHHHFCDMFALKLKNVELFWEPTGNGYSCSDLRGEKIDQLSLLGSFEIPKDVPGKARVYGVRYNDGDWKFEELGQPSLPFPIPGPGAGNGGMIIRPLRR